MWGSEYGEQEYEETFLSRDQRVLERCVSIRSVV